MADPIDVQYLQDKLADMIATSEELVSEHNQLLAIYKGLIGVAENGQLGDLALVDTLSDARIGNLQPLLAALTLSNVAGRDVIGNGDNILSQNAFGLGGQGYPLQNFDSPPTRNEFFHGSGDATGDVPPGANFLPGIDLYRAGSQRAARLVIGSDTAYVDTWSGSVLNARFRLYNNRNVLGAVSLSGGLPTGALMEIGENANGMYLKLASGTMISTGALAVNLSNALAQTTRNFPASFSTPPHVSIAGTSFTGSSGTAAALQELRANPPTTTAARIQCGLSTANATLDVEYIAFGRWQ